MNKFDMSFPVVDPCDYELTIMMPCLNEVATVAVCVKKAKQFLEVNGIAGEVLVADNGSTDGSQIAAETAGARVVAIPARGYGAALLGGIDAAQGRFVVMGDADDSYNFSSLEGFVAELRNGADLVIGNRFRGGIEKNAMPFLHRYLGNPVLSFLGRLLYRTHIGDFHCGLRGFSRARILELGLKSSGMEFASEMVMKASMSGLKITEVPTTLQPDGRGRPPHLNTWRDGWRHLKLLLSYAPDHVFVAPALLCLLPGLLLLLSLAGGPLQFSGVYLGAHFLALGSLLSLVGVNLLVFGVLAKLIAIKKVPLAEAGTPAVKFFLNRFKVEHGLLIGLLFFLVGSAIDGALLVRWLQFRSMPMEDTVHMAFFASTLIAIGLCVMLSSFLIALLIDKD